jgi:hypothetical protein
VIGVLKLKERNADVGFLAQLARELVNLNAEVKKEPTQSQALGQERGSVRTRVERYLSVFRKDWQHVATAELAGMRKGLMQQVMDTGESGVRF